MAKLIDVDIPPEELKQCCEQEQTAPVMLDETEQRILRKFRELREKGRKNQYIHNPTAWALYWTWKDLETWSNVIDRREADDA